MNDNSKVAAALIAGLATGAILGILFAPEKGEETRDRLSSALNNLKEDALEKASAELDKLVSLKNELTQQVKESFASGKEDIRDGLTDNIEEA